MVQSPEQHFAIPAVEGVPPPQESTTFLVSAMVLAQCRRDDLFAPDTGPVGVVRDADDLPVGVKRLVRCPD